MSAAPALTSAEDATGAALEEAAGLALRVLQAITLVLLLGFLGSGVFTVESNEVAFLSRSGVQDETELGPGLHWRWQVIDEVVRVKKTARELGVASFDLRKTQAGLKGEETRQRAGISPEHDGSLLSGDGALLHVAVALRYAPRAPYLRSVQTFDPRHEEAALRVLTERAVLRAAAGRTLEDLLGAGKGDFLADAQARIQDALDELEAGLEVKGVDLEGDLRPSPQVRDAFALVTQATQEVSKARSESARRATELRSLKLGQAAEILTTARSKATRIATESRSLAERFEAALPEYRRDRRAFRERRLARALAEGLAETGESFLVGEGELRIKLERDTRGKREALKRAARERLGLSGGK